MTGVLFIGAGTPWRGSAGHHVRQQMLLAGAYKLGPVRAILYEDGSGRSDEIPEGIESVLWLPRDEKMKGVVRGRVGDLLDPVPRMLRVRAADSGRDLVRDFVDSFHPEIILAYRIEFLLASGLLGDPRVCLDIDDPEHIRRARAAALRGKLDWRSAVDLRKLRWYERRAVRRSRLAFVCNEQDAAAFDPPALVIPNAVDVPDDVPERLPGSRTVLFVGNLSRGGANVDGLRWFIDKVWPLMSGATSGFELRVIGRGAMEFVMEAIVSEHVEGVGFIEDLSVEYANAAVAIAPIRYGTGTRIKILEAMAHGCPVVSTSMGAEGIAATHGKNILLADDPQDFVAAISRVVTDHVFARQISMEGRMLVSSRYGRASVAEDLAQHIASSFGLHRDMGAS